MVQQGQLLPLLRPRQKSLERNTRPVLPQSLEWVLLDLLLCWDVQLFENLYKIGTRNSTLPDLN